jgi:copper chaperone CopZ
MKVKIEGMSCNHCKMRVEKALKQVQGVDEVQVDLEGKTAEIKGNPDLEAVKAAVEDTGYDFLGEV